MTKKIVLITGASSGFGAAIAKHYATLGYKLILVARRLDRLQTIREAVDVDCHLIKLDVRDREAVEDAINSLPADFVDIDILINNAGLALGLEPAYAAAIQDWEIMVDTNIKGLMYFTRAVSSGMVARHSGHIVNVGSIAGDWPYPGGNCYGASKAFVKQFSLNLRADFHGTRIRVTNIEPGLAETEFSVVRFHGDQQKADNIYKKLQPLVADDIAEAVIWATSLPAHVNINRIEIMPTCQSFGPLVLDK